VVLLPLWIIGPDIKAGRLQQLVPDYHWPDSAIQAVYPPGRHLSARVRAFVDFLVEQFAA
jgi:DNA-binding transcriptional LysR family regulator